MSNFFVRHKVWETLSELLNKSFECKWKSNYETHKLLKDRTEWSTQNSSFIYDNLNTFILISYPPYSQDYWQSRLHEVLVTEGGAELQTWAIAWLNKERARAVQITLSIFDYGQTEQHCDSSDILHYLASLTLCCMLSIRSSI